MLRPLILILWFHLLSSPVWADDSVNVRMGPDPGAEAKIGRVLADTYAAGNPPQDNIQIQYAPPPGSGVDTYMNQSVGSVYSAGNGPVLRDNITITRDNIQICCKPLP